MSTPIYDKCHIQYGKWKMRNENVSLVIADFSDLSQIRRLAAGVKTKYPQLHALVNNAGSYNGVQSGCNVICRRGAEQAPAKRKWPLSRTPAPPSKNPKRCPKWPRRTVCR
jgi:NAD(P)-dependent dehydrogenase (short-subunit alcohol dehydrogenase family)